MREIRYYLDPATGQPHIYNHNVDESEVEDILSHPLKDEPSRDDSRVAIGKTSAEGFSKWFIQETKTAWDFS